MKKDELENKCSYTDSGLRTKFREPLVRFWRDLYDDQAWKYEELSPVELLEKAGIQRKAVPEDELDRVDWFWRRQPRVLSVVAWICWLTSAIGAAFCVMIPCLGLPVLLASVALVLFTIARSVRWRREYELSIDRLIRTSGSGSAAFERNVVP